METISRNPVETAVNDGLLLVAAETGTLTQVILNLSSVEHKSGLQRVVFCATTPGTITSYTPLIRG